MNAGIENPNMAVVSVIQVTDTIMNKEASQVSGEMEAKTAGATSGNAVKSAIAIACCLMDHSLGIVRFEMFCVVSSNIPTLIAAKCSESSQAGDNRLQCHFGNAL